MLRACHETLKPGGRIGGYTIHSPEGLSGGDATRAAELGPSEVLADASPAALLRAAGFRVTVDEDVTPRFATTCEALVRARGDLEDELRTAEGDDAFEEEQGKKARMIEGISVGLLRRSLIVGSRI